MQVRVVREAYYGKAKRRADDGVGQSSVPGIWLSFWTFVENKGPNWLRFVILFWVRPGAIRPCGAGRYLDFKLSKAPGPPTGMKLVVGVLSNMRLSKSVRERR